MSPFSIIPCVLSLLAFLVCVRAGHSSWERPAQFVAADNATALLEKRYFSIQPRGTFRVWPGAEIKYCFENDAAKRLLYQIQAGMERWHAAGLPADRFKLTQVSASECKNRRSEVLLISANNDGRLGATPGLPPLDDTDPGYKGPTMQLSDSTSVGMLEVTANFAHELGHAWGLLHEHQDPTYWGLPYSTSGVSNKWTFNCQNLKDYNEVAARLTPDKLEEACRSRNVASKEKFSASEYLPLLGGGRGEGGGTPDLESIMIYPSGAGATGAASPGNDGRTAILVNEDGSRIPINLYPSKRDVAGILKLYDTNWDTTNPTLLNSPSNSLSAKFKNVFKKKRCL
ncbi:MAG: hypothetical protein LQ344_001734 [Seirophora lacunosa]|nr:MAG: hypothetical protein LQ344_001734 [Seirophora lacunosa]